MTSSSLAVDTAHTLPAGAAHLLAAALRDAGSTVAFGVPGGGPNLDVVGALDAVGIRFVLAHAETSACIMASVFGHLTATPAAAVVTRGPGAAAAVNGAAQATLDRYPLVLVTDTVAQAQRVRVPHQRIDQQSMLAPVAKLSAVLTDQMVSSEVARLVALALDGRPGTVHLDYDAGAADAVIDLPDPAPVPDDSAESYESAREQIAAADRPVVIVGLGAVRDAASIASAMSAFAAPVLTTYQAVGVVPSESDLCAGLFTNGASERALLEQADLIITIGLDTVEPIPATWNYDAPVVSLNALPDPDPYLPVEVEVVGPLSVTVPELVIGEHDWAPDAGVAYRDRIRARLAESAPAAAGRRLTPVELVKAAAESCPDDAIVTVDAGAHFLAIMPFWPVRAANELLISNGLATMGFALPAAIGASLAHPGRPVLCLVGDGGLGMTLAELETLARLDVPVAVIVFNDSALSLIEIKQRAGHGGDAAVKYAPMNFAAIASAVGVDSVTVSSTDQLAEALDGGWERPLLIDVGVDPAQYRHLISETRG